MFRSLLLFLFALLLFSCSVQNQLVQKGLSTNIYEDVKELSADEMKGREVGTSGEKKAAKYIAERYQKIGLTPMGNGDQEGVDQSSIKAYFQDFTAFESTNPHATDDSPGSKTPVSARNVVGLLDHGAKHTVVIGGHYDHLGFGSFGSLYTGPAEIHNGADDNASGIAALLYLAELLIDEKYSHSNYLFIAFSGEEKGLWGSNYWTKNPTYPVDKLNYMINFDMVGRMENKKFAINGTGTSPSWSLIDKVTKGYDVVKSESGLGPSDHSSFYLIDVPAIHFFTGQHEDYHKPTDDIEKVNVEGIYQISQMIIDLIQKLKGEKLVFTKTKDVQASATVFKVTLGVIPDYLYNEGGMRIDGVQEGKTASEGGIEKGDIVVKMGDLEIVDMNSYMKALGAFEPGMSTDVVVLRKGKKVTKTVTFQ